MIGRCSEGEEMMERLQCPAGEQFSMSSVRAHACKFTPGVFFIQRFALDHLPVSSQTGPAPVAFTLILSHVDKFGSGWL